MSISDKHKFYLIIIYEMVLLPILVSLNYIKWRFGVFSIDHISKQRAPVLEKIVSVCIHEWGGYDGSREKKIKGIRQFSCGLSQQLERFRKYKGDYEVNVCVTVSDIHLMKSRPEGVDILEVSNKGMDFSGYASFYNTIKDSGNQYVILTNSSVNNIQSDFLDGYIDYMEKNPSVGLMGVSYSSKIYQSLIRNNFNPHIQSFFLLTTTSVLKELVAKEGRFPGAGLSHKLLLIRRGEVRFSELILSLNYDLAVVTADGAVHKFNKNFKKDNGRLSWQLPKGDYRLHIEHPNAINPIIATI